MSKQSAVEWLVEQIKKDSNLRLRGFDIDGIGKQAKEMEEQQRGYSEEDMINALHSVELKDNKDYSKIYNGMKVLLEELKKK